MGSIEIELFTTLDLVGQAPGGPEEDPEGGFAFGGWQAPLLDDVAGAQIAAAYEGTDALLLGRRTYDIFASYWPFQEGGQDDDFAALFNLVPKYVASRGEPDLPWAGSTLLGKDLPAAVREVRDRHGPAALRPRRGDSRDGRHERAGARRRARRVTRGRDTTGPTNRGGTA